MGRELRYIFQYILDLFGKITGIGARVVEFVSAEFLASSNPSPLRKSFDASMIAAVGRLRDFDRPSPGLSETISAIAAQQFQGPPAFESAQAGAHNSASSLASAFFH